MPFVSCLIRICLYSSFLHGTYRTPTKGKPSGTCDRSIKESHRVKGLVQARSQGVSKVLEKDTADYCILSHSQYLPYSCWTWVHIVEYSSDYTALFKGPLCPPSLVLW